MAGSYFIYAQPDTQDMKDIADSHLIYSTDNGSICPDCSKPFEVPKEEYPRVVGIF